MADYIPGGHAEFNAWLDNFVTCAGVSLGRLLRRQRRLQEAVEVLQEAAGMSPSNAAIRFLLGDTLEAQGRHEQAAEQYRQVLQIDPNHAEARRRLEAAGRG